MTRIVEASHELHEARVTLGGDLVEHTLFASDRLLVRPTLVDGLQCQLHTCRDMLDEVYRPKAASSDSTNLNEVVEVELWPPRGPLDKSSRESL